MPVVSTNSLILLLPPRLFKADLLPLFQAHFATYGPGEMVLWSPLERLGRVLVAYDSVESATAARREMDGFVWEDEAEARASGSKDGEGELAEATLPLRAFFGPTLALPLPSLEQTLLSVPALSRNFLISPPGSPPVGWEQTLEEAPNPNPLPTSDEGGAGDDGGWASELSRALRFLSTTSGGDEEDQAAVSEQDQAADEAEGDASITQLLVPTSSTIRRPAVTVSTPGASSGAGSGTNSAGTTGTPPPPGAQKITSVKATIESLLGRKRSYSDLSQPQSPSVAPPIQPSLTNGFSNGNGSALGAGGHLGLGEGGAGGGKKSSITPTARPPIAGDAEYRPV